MKRKIGLLSVLLGIVGFGMLFLSGALGLGFVTIIGLVMIAAGIAGGLMSAAIEEGRDSTSWTTKPDEESKMPTKDKGQLPLGGYTSGHR
jgi:hypothetical protein